LLEGKIAIVTGATKGIGFEIARRFVKEGATVVLCSRDLARSQQSAARLGKKAVPEEVDISDRASVAGLIRRIDKRFNHLDILVNNAGYPFDRKIWYKQFHEVGDDELDRVLAVDLQGTVRISKGCIPLMLKGGGVIISITSTPAIAGHVEGAPYTLAKSAVIAMTKHIALEYGKNKVRAYALALGNIATEATFDAMTEAERKKAASENAMKRWGKPEEVARVAASVASDDFEFATGNTLVVDGGTVLH
jgi:NAD(P)-dependent dehydrogenase (short-subunit alcohol dehydrogenase family)